MGQGWKHRGQRRGPQAPRRGDGSQLEPWRQGGGNPLRSGTGAEGRASKGQPVGWAGVLTLNGVLLGAKGGPDSPGKKERPHPLSEGWERLSVMCVCIYMYVCGCLERKRE